MNIINQVVDTIEVALPSCLGSVGVRGQGLGVKFRVRARLRCREVRARVRVRMRVGFALGIRSG